MKGKQSMEKESNVEILKEYALAKGVPAEDVEEYVRKTVFSMIGM